MELQDEGAGTNRTACQGSNDLMDMYETEAGWQAHMNNMAPQAPV